MRAEDSTEPPVLRESRGLLIGPSKRYRSISPKLLAEIFEHTDTCLQRSLRNERQAAAVGRNVESA